ncbi:DUF4376 domain-containing protein [Burkholderia cepacia]|uniref:DUF4376 domain-containing protein n=1 Tax=Burkholderia cepacia TaxID=292 RepID=UPI000667CA68|nr:DUF4376 domain-containing protein [Burkholderia cepacia]MDN7763808.1 DUF4376 domain-containing protein [Burkholderia cepacia]
MDFEYYVFADVSGNITGSGATRDGTIPEGAIACTKDQASDPSAYSVSGGSVVTPSGAQRLKQAQDAQLTIVAASYTDAIMQPVSFKTTGGITDTFQADPGSQTVLMQTTQGYSIAGGVPDGFFWVAADNTHVPFTLADLEGLYQAMLARGWAAFLHKQALKDQINAATTIEAVQAITW